MWKIDEKIIVDILCIGISRLTNCRIQDPLIKMGMEMATQLRLNSLYACCGTQRVQTVHGRRGQSHECRVIQMDRTPWKYSSIVPVFAGLTAVSEPLVSRLLVLLHLDEGEGFPGVYIFIIHIFHHSLIPLSSSFQYLT